MGIPPGLGRRLSLIGAILDGIIMKICALLVAVMVLIVWFGILSRYGLSLGVTWTEELSRYVMIWAALLAIPVGVFRREHIGLELVFGMVPHRVRKPLRAALDILAITFFAFLAWYGTGMAIQGANQFATIFGMSMMVPFAAVPVSAAIAAFQATVLLVRDLTLDLDEMPGLQMEDAE